MDIHLHLGAHQCANKTFHTFLASNRMALSESNIAVWSPDRTRNGLMRGLIRPPQKITIEDEYQAIRSIGRMRVELARLERKGTQALLISDPDFLGTFADNFTETTLYPLLFERLKRLRPIFEGHPLHIGLTVRSFEDYWTSGLNRNLIQKGTVPTVDCLDFLTTQTRHWRHVVSDITKAFPQARTVVWPFERVKASPEVILQTLCDRQLAGIKQSSEWLGRSADLAKLNETLVACDQRSLVANAPKHSQRWMPFDDHQRRVLRAEYRRDLAWLKTGADAQVCYVDGRKTSTLHRYGWGSTDKNTPGLSPARGRGRSNGNEKRMG